MCVEPLDIESFWKVDRMKCIDLFKDNQMCDCKFSTITQEKQEMRAEIDNDVISYLSG